MENGAAGKLADEMEFYAPILVSDKPYSVCLCFCGGDLYCHLRGATARASPLSAQSQAGTCSWWRGAGDVFCSSPRDGSRRGHYDTGYERRRAARHSERGVLV